MVDKPFRTINQQIEILESRGVKTDDETRMVLMCEGYYPVVNGYKNMFLDVEKTRRAHDDRYLPGTRFSDIYRLFTYDRELRMTFMKYFAMAESTLKTICAYKFTQAHKDRVNPYLDVTLYSDSAQTDGKAPLLVRDFKKCLQGPYKRNYLKHYAEHHAHDVPLWVLMNYMMLGQAFKFFDFQTDAMKNEIARGYSTLYEASHGTPRVIHSRELIRAYDHIKDFRNICAHDERLYCSRVSKARDIPVARVMKDLEIVLPMEQHKQMLLDVATLTIGVMQDLGEVSNGLLKDMGVSSVNETFAFGE